MQHENRRSLWHRHYQWSGKTYPSHLIYYRLKILLAPCLNCLPASRISMDLFITIENLALSHHLDRVNKASHQFTIRHVVTSSVLQHMCNVFSRGELKNNFRLKSLWISETNLTIIVFKTTNFISSMSNYLH